MAGLNDYDPSRVIASFGTIPLLGFMDGTMIEVERSEDGWGYKAGGQGDGVRVKNLNRSAELTINLLKSSPANAMLSAMAALDERTNAGKAPFLIKDLNGLTVAEAPVAWIKKMPKLDFGDDETGVTWVFTLHDFEVVHAASPI